MPWTVAYQAPPSMGFSRQECWSRLPFPSPGDIPDPGIEPKSPALWADALPSEPPRKPTQFPDSAVGIESTCNAGDSGSNLGSGRSTAEGIDCPLQYCWASLVAQLIKNLSAMWETWVRSLGWEDPLEKRKATDSSILAWRIPWNI